MFCAVGLWRRKVSILLYLGFYWIYFGKKVNRWGDMRKKKKFFTFLLSCNEREIYGGVCDLYFEKVSNNIVCWRGKIKKKKKSSILVSGKWFVLFVVVHHVLI